MFVASVWAEDRAVSFGSKRLVAGKNFSHRVSWIGRPGNCPRIHELLGV